jgi:hypothetical protein
MKSDVQIWIFNGTQQISLYSLWAIDLTIQRLKYIDVPYKTHPLDSPTLTHIPSRPRRHRPSSDSPFIPRPTLIASCLPLPQPRLSLPGAVGRRPSPQSTPAIEESVVRQARD